MVYFNTKYLATGRDTTAQHELQQHVTRVTENVTLCGGAASVSPSRPSR
jgi:hypothetical protein